VTLFEREDWTVFRSLDGITQKAGVPLRLLRRLVLKELADNALDCGGTCQLGQLEGGGYFIADEGGGIPGNADEIARLFSIRRPLSSSKLLRLPTRGALGNGLRVVAGAILASNGRLEVVTHGFRHALTPLDDGATAVDTMPVAKTAGTRIEIYLGDSIPDDPHALEWAQAASDMAGHGKVYSGKPSVWWYTPSAFFELLSAAGDRSVRDLMTVFDGLSGAKAGRVVKEFKGRPADSLNRDETERLLADARAMTKAIPSSRLGRVGKLFHEWPGYGKETGSFALTSGQEDLGAEIPFVVEAWARLDSDDDIDILVNRTPIVAEITIQRIKKRGHVGIFDCGLRHAVKIGQGPLGLKVNITTPYMPILSDGKAPNLEHFVNEVVEALQAAARRAVRSSSCGGARRTQKDIITDNLASAIDKVSGSGTHRFSQRQLYYATRPNVIASLGKEPDFNYFATVITDYEFEYGEIEGLYRDNRGALYHPHIGEEIPLGTLSVEQYQRPEWIFRRVLYSEKEGLFAILKAARWPERHDCALLTSKGFASRAARDLLDFLGETDEPVEFYCIHDADASGTMIYQSLQEATRARPGRRVEIVNLGLEPWEALEHGFEIEPVTESKTRRPVADYVPEEWDDWFQSNRVELNAMTSPQLIEWLDDKMAEHSSGKLIPPATVIADRYENDVRVAVRQEIQDRILAEADLDGQVDERMDALAEEIAAEVEHLPTVVRSRLETEPKSHWSVPVEQRVDMLLELKKR
jgi:hypothetical protein